MAAVRPITELGEVDGSKIFYHVIYKASIHHRCGSSTHGTTTQGKVAATQSFRNQICLPSPASYGKPQDESVSSGGIIAGKGSFAAAAPADSRGATMYPLSMASTDHLVISEK